MNNQAKTISAFSLFFLWFGAAISIAEIFTGALFVPLGFSKGVLAIIIGHIIGVIILGLGGIIGSEKRLPALASTRISFGKYGSYGFSVLNILQLMGWTAVMIIAGARSVNEISQLLWGYDSIQLWSIVIGMLICIWIGMGISNINKLHYGAIGLLFILTIVLSTVIFKDSSIFSLHGEGSMSFGAAVELSVIMPLSWLPLIADYTRFSKSTRGGFLGSTGGYFIGSCWMYIIGLGAALVAGNPDPSSMLLAVNMGITALGIVVLSTVTTTFLDAYSAGVTFLNIFPKVGEKKIALLMGIVGTVIAILFPIEQYENFLYAIGSVFAPLFAVLLTEYFLFSKKQIESNKNIYWRNVLIWAVGVYLYYQFINFDFILGSTLPVMLITSILCIINKGVIDKWILSKAILKQ